MSQHAVILAVHCPADLVDTCGTAGLEFRGEREHRSWLLASSWQDLTFQFHTAISESCEREHPGATGARAATRASSSSIDIPDGLPSGASRSGGRREGEPWVRRPFTKEFHLGTHAYVRTSSTPVVRTLRANANRVNTHKTKMLRKCFRTTKLHHVLH